MENTIDTNSLLVQLRTLARDAGIPPSSALAREVQPGSESINFSDILEKSVQQVNGYGQQSMRLRESFEAGNPGVELSDVMIAAQKARISFEALTQVRNKVVAAYKEIMSMPL